MLLDVNQFLVELGKLYNEAKTTGTRSVWVTYKRHYPELKGAGTKRRRAEVPEHAVLVCLVRATNGKTKISTMVPANEVPRFVSGMSGVIRLGISDLHRNTPKKNLTQ